MAVADPRIKQLKIKTGVVKRNYKEKVSYEKEAQQIQEKIKKMQDDGEEVYYIKKQDQLLLETHSVILDCQKRLNVSYYELKAMVTDEIELAENEDFIAAKNVLNEAAPHVTA